MIIRAKTFERWMKANFTKDELRDLAQHGADTGWQGMTYPADTAALYRRFGDEIWEALIEDAKGYGDQYRNVFEFIADFRRANNVANRAQVENLLVWYMAERTAHRLVDADAR